jgi:hypothetical protein
MKPASFLALLFFTTGMVTTHAGWIVGEHAISYSRQQGVGYATFEEALKKLVDDKHVQALDTIFAYDLLGEESFQKEIFARLEHDAPRKLKAALDSKGDIHNPKVLQLWKPFEKAVLATSILQKINSALAVQGLGITRVGCEKFETRHRDTGPYFAGLMTFAVGRLSAATTKP